MKERLLKLLHRMAFSAGQSGAGTVIDLSQVELARMLAASRQTLNRLLRELEREGLLTLSYRAIQLTDRARVERSYVFEHGELFGLKDLTLKTNRLGSIAVAIDAVATDVRGKQHVLYSTPLVGAPWSCYTGTMLYVAMSRWMTDQGRIGYGLNMENHPLDMMARLRGRRWDQPPGVIYT